MLLFCLIIKFISCSNKLKYEVEQEALRPNLVRIELFLKVSLFLTLLLDLIGIAGYSHKPEEYASIEDIANGVKVLALTLAKLSLD